MEHNRVFDILKSKEKSDVFYDERPVWIQELNDNVAKIGFIDTFEEKDVYIEDLYENNSYKGEKNNF